MNALICTKTPEEQIKEMKRLGWVSEKLMKAVKKRKYGKVAKNIAEMYRNRLATE